jgi:hypothetical protein
MSTAYNEEWRERVRNRLVEDDLFARYADAVDSTVRFDVGEATWAFTIVEDGTVQTHQNPTYVAWDYALRGSEQTWSKLLADEPPPPYQDLIGAWFAGDLTLEGDLESAVREIRALKRILDVFAAEQ